MSCRRTRRGGRYEEPHLSSSFCHVKLVTVEDLPENVTADEHEDNTDENGEEALEKLEEDCCGPPPPCSPRTDCLGVGLTMDHLQATKN